MPTKSSQPMPPSFARGVGWVFAFLTLLTTAGAVWAARADSDAHTDLTRFDAAPVCAPATPPAATTNCKAEVRAVIVAAKITKARAPIGVLTLRTADGDRLTADMKPDLTPDANEDADVTVWHGHAAIVRTDGEGDITTYESPAWQISNYGYAYLGAISFTVLFESVAARYLLYFKCDRQRMAAAHLLAAGLLLVAAILRVSHQYSTVVVTSFVLPLVVLALYAAWPRIAWARGRPTRP